MCSFKFSTCLSVPATPPLTNRENIFTHLLSHSALGWVIRNCNWVSETLSLKLSLCDGYHLQKWWYCFYEFHFANEESYNAGITSLRCKLLKDWKCRGCPHFQGGENNNDGKCYLCVWEGRPCNWPSWEMARHRKNSSHPSSSSLPASFALGILT